MSDIITIQGLVATDICIPRGHIHGDTHQLLNEPQHNHLFIRRILPRSTVQQPSNWRTQNARSVLPSAEKPTPTFFRGQVYPHIQHALFACLLWHTGGSKGSFQSNTFPGSFPMVCVKDAAAVFLETPDMKGEVVGLHWLECQPSHTQILELGQSLKESNIRWCMLVIGQMKPADARWPAGQPQFQCMLLDARQFDNSSQCIPTDAIVLGWQMCLGPTLCFSLHGELEGKAMPPAILPPIISMMARLWRRVDTAYFAIDGKVRDETTWDTAIHGALENQLRQAF
jgi:hypothetical protein